MNQKENDTKLQVIPPPVHANAKSIVQAMSQVSLRDLEIVGLKNQNKNLKNTTLNKEEERKDSEGKYKELLEKNDKLMKQVT